MQIFLSYSSEDRDRVLPLVEALEDDGYSVWWDREIRPGPSFDREIEKAIGEASCVVVVWSENAVESEWVRSEVEEGVRRDVLVPVIFDAVLPPLAYRRRQSADLSDWQGKRDGEYEKLLSGIQAVLAQEGNEKDHGTIPAGHETTHRKRRQRIRVGPAGIIGAVTVSAVLGFGLALLNSAPAPAPPGFT
jgi:hypothetical protein